jgi:hypothetical protein
MRTLLPLLFLLFAGCDGNQPPPNPDLYENTSRKTSNASGSEIISSSPDIVTDQETRLAIQSAIEECGALVLPANPRQVGYYYDLSQFACTTRPLFLGLQDCTLDNITDANNPDMDYLAPNQKEQVRQIFQEDYRGFEVTFCVDDGPKFYTVVGVKDDPSALHYEIVERRVPK